MVKSRNRNYKCYCSGIRVCDRQRETRCSCEGIYHRFWSKIFSLQLSKRKN